MFDLVIQNGFIIDPASRIASRLNIGVKNGKVEVLTGDTLQGRTLVEAEGLIVTPGFVDMHMHEDPYHAEANTFEYLISKSMLRMGVTTAVGGNCGIGIMDNPVEYLELIDRIGCPVNLGMLSPHEQLRAAIGNFSRYEPLAQSDIVRMGELLQTHLDGGCLGLSLGMEYIPGIDKAEATTLMRIAKKNDKIVTVHQRSDGDKAVLSVEELAGYVAETGARLHISHLSSMCSFGSMEKAISIIDCCRSKDFDILFDGYPYYAFCTSIGSAVFDEGFLEKYRFGEEYYQRLQVDEKYLKEAEIILYGNRMTREGFYALREKNPNALVVAHLLNGAEVDLCITHPASIIVSDGLYSNGTGHPRGSGAFPKLIREYVIERKLLTLEAAIEKITYLPAQRMGLSGKGSLKPGADADITIFDLDRIRDGATYQEPLRQPEGIEYVIINGEIALESGQIVNDRLGRSIRK